MAKVEVISSCLVATAGINPTPLSKLELTPWDLQLLLLVPIQKGILLPNPQSKQTLISLLKNSLSRALDFFPPLAGRLSSAANDDGTTSFFVDCNNAGAQFIHAVAAGVSISDILEPEYKPEIIFSFFPQSEMLNFEGISKPLWAAQVTELDDGVFIGCAANHAVADGTSFWDFFNAWSEISRGSEIISKSPVFQRVFPINISGESRRIRLPPLEQDLSYSRSFVEPPFLEKVLHFSKESLAKLKSQANSEAGSEKITSLQALSALLWRSYTRCNYQTNPEAKFIIIIGARVRIPLPEGYFGNAVCIARTATCAAELLQEGLGFAAMKIHEIVAQQSRERLIGFVEDWAINPNLHRKGSFGFAITSSPRHNVYSNDFGWGRPIAVRSGKVHKFDGKMTLFPAAETGGIDVEVCFSPDTWEAMGDCKEIMEALTS